MSDMPASISAVVVDTTVVKNNAPESVSSTARAEPANQDLSKVTFGGSMSTLKAQHPDLYNKFMNLSMYQACVDAKKHGDHMREINRKARQNSGG